MNEIINYAEHRYPELKVLRAKLEKRKQKLINACLNGKNKKIRKHRMKIIRLEAKIGAIAHQVSLETKRIIEMAKTNKDNYI